MSSVLCLGLDHVPKMLCMAEGLQRCGFFVSASGLGHIGKEEGKAREYSLRVGQAIEKQGRLGQIVDIAVLGILEG